MLMQVMKLGVLRVVAQKIPALLKVLCAGGLARFGSVAKTIVAMNERIRHFGRLIMASLVSPGYVQSTSYRISIAVMPVFSAVLLTYPYPTLTSGFIPVFSSACYCPPVSIRFASCAGTWCARASYKRR